MVSCPLRAHIKHHKQKLFTFIDLFAGIGGIRKGFEDQGGQCVFTSEWNKFARKTYRANYPDDPSHPFVGDITAVKSQDVPNHDVLLAGFPCQPFSIAGVSRKNSRGRPHGFEDETQGTLFFEVVRILSAKRPAAFLLENVKNLVSHHKGRTLNVMLDTLTKVLGYQVSYQIIDGQHFVPQHRERLFLVGFREPTAFSWDDYRFPKHYSPTMADILHPQNGDEESEPPFTLGRYGRVNKKYTLTPKLWAYLQAYAEKHRKAGNGLGYGMVDGDSISRTLSARYYKDGSEILVNQEDEKPPRGLTPKQRAKLGGLEDGSDILVSQKGKQPPRRLTPRECARLMGFEDTFIIPVSDTQAYQQFGNGVIVPVIAETARIMKPHLMKLLAKRPCFYF